MLGAKHRHHAAPDLESRHRPADQLLRRLAGGAGQHAYDNAFKIQWEEFLKHVALDTPFPWTLREGAKGVQLAELGLQSWWVVRTNLQGPYFLTQAVARWLVEQKAADAAFAGCVVNVSSISATMASINRGEYCVSKAGLSMATQLWAVRLAPHGIPVYEVQPGITATDMTAGVKKKYDDLIAAGLTLQPRWGTPDDVGRAVAMLVRGDLPYSTGQVISVDGGMRVERL
jgi:NAD(P)-dependent dehydrogenase (short-subunit alcohol dehydrogenase family)